MARIGRLDVGFSLKDQDLWVFLNQFNERDRSYWLKYYALLGISAASNGKTPVLPIIQSSIPAEPTNRQPRRKKKETEFIIPHTLADSNADTESKSEDVPILKPIEVTIQKKKVDPMELRRRVMENFLTPDQDLLKALESGERSSEEKVEENREVQTLNSK